MSPETLLMINHGPVLATDHSSVMPVSPIIAMDPMIISTTQNHFFLDKSNLVFIIFSPFKTE